MGSTPLTLRCPFCKRGEDWESFNRRSNKGLKPTGRSRIASSYCGHINVQLVEVHHDACSRTFWTSHPSVTTNHRHVGNSGHRGWTRR